MLDKFQDCNILKGSNERTLFFHDDIDDITVNVLKSFILEINDTDDSIENKKNYFVNIEERDSVNESGEVEFDENSNKPKKVLIETSIWGEDYNRDENPIVLHCTSYGGNLLDLFSLIDIVENSKTPIYIHISGYAQSAMTILCLFAKKSTATKRTKWMIHNMSASGGYGNMTVLKDRFKENLELENEIRCIYEKYTNIPKDILDLIFNQSKDFTFSSDKALEWGLIDEIV